MYRRIAAWRVHAVLIFGVWGSLPVPAALAHSISTVEAEAVVHRDKVELAVTVRSEDILLSGGMAVINTDRIRRSIILKGAEAHKQFLLDGLILSDSDGRRLSGKVASVKMFAVPEAGIPLGELLGKTAVYYLEYPLARPPASLGVRQHFNTGPVAIPVVMHMTVFREGASTATLIAVPEAAQPERVAFDWAQLPEPCRPRAKAGGAGRPAAARHCRGVRLHPERRDPRGNPRAVAGPGEMAGDRAQQEGRSRSGGTGRGPAPPAPCSPPRTS